VSDELVSSDCAIKIAPPNPILLAKNGINQIEIMKRFKITYHINSNLLEMSWFQVIVQLILLLLIQLNCLN
jgi:hypothetical protein